MSNTKILDLSPPKKLLVIIESPLAANLERTVEQHRVYARACMRDSVIHHGEAPFASHLLYDQPGLLDDLNPVERAFGIEAGLAWGTKADLTAVYTDCGISNGMRMGIARAEKEGRQVVYRTIDPTLFDIIMR